MALALAIPLLLAATLGGLRVQNDLAEASNASTSAKQVTVLSPAVDYLKAAETAMVAAQGSSTNSEGDLLDALDDIDQTSKALKASVDGADLNGLQAEQVNALLDLSQAIRGEDAADLSPATWIALVRQLESGVSQLVSHVNAAQATPEPRLEQLSQALNGRLSLAMQQALISNEQLAQSGSQDLFSELGVEAAAIDRLAGSLDAKFADEVADLRTTNASHAGLVQDDAALDLGGRESYRPYDAITTSLLKGVEKSLNKVAGDARQSALVGALITLAALAAAIGLAVMVARSLLGPIGKVRDGALAVARQKLPDAVTRIRAGEQPEPINAIDVHTNEEIGQVARAVDDLHRQAIHLASGEAQLRQTVNAMFVTLSRRSNSLVNQQLAQIERLEQDEEDPKRLESLFRLDHLASRMRRTADSLLILADAPNKAAGQFSLTVGEALQAATSGVQDYQRVQIMSHLNTRISEDAAADVVHLLTELVDNALTFSPPTEPVRLNATLGADGVTLTVTDAGLGVPATELEAFNQDLAGDVEATPETARRMGLFVVSRLAERHGIKARLAKNPGGGLTATVVMPATILPELPQPARPARTAVPAGAVPSTSTTEVLAKGAPEAPAKGSPAKAPSKTAAKTSAPGTPLTGAAKASTVKETLEPAAGGLLSRFGKNRGDKAAEKAAARAEKDAAKQKSVDDKAAQKAAEQEAAAKAASEKAAAAKAASEKAAAEKAAADKAAADKAAAEKAAALKAASDTAGTPDLSTGAGDPDRPPLGTLLPRREPGANMPKTGADAFLPPETSGATGPLFGKRSAAPKPSGEGTSMVDKVASVVPITALAARQRAQAEEEARTQQVLGGSDEDQAAETAVEEAPAAETAETAEPVETAETVETVEETPVAETELEEAPVAEAAVEEAAVEEARVADPLTDPLPEAEPVAETPVVEETVAQAPVTEAEPVVVETPEPVVETPAEDPLGVGAPAALNGSVAASPLPTRSPGSAPEINRDMPGLPPSRPTEPAASNGNDAPIFKSMRSGFLAGDGQRDWHETEIDRGWEIAEHVAEETPVVESTSVGLPRRQPGERLVPGGVAAPAGAKTRDPEAIRRRLQSHTAGVSRGRRAASNTSRHTEAGPA